MKVFFLLFLLTLVACTSQPPTATPLLQTSSVNLNDYQHIHSIVVRECKSMAFVPIYQDEELAIPLPNPLTPDTNGYFAFFVKHKTCIVVADVLK